jgi:hypothetical protein
MFISNYYKLLNIWRKMFKKIWTPFKIWNETQWFNDIETLIEKYQNEKKGIY